MALNVHRKDVPYTFKFDETTTSQVLKQYDGYLSSLCFQYDGYLWSPMYDELVNIYAGSLFMDHCTAVDLVTHFYGIVQPLGIKGVNLLHLGMDGPRVNRKFEKELQASLHEKEDTSILLFRNMLTRSHPHRLQKWDFRSRLPIRDFFFKLSAAQREDYVGVDVVTGIAAELAKKFGATRWLCMKQVWIFRICEKYAYDEDAFWYCFQYTCFFISIQKLEFMLG